jgi:hypothetical protein
MPQPQHGSATTINPTNQNRKSRHRPTSPDLKNTLQGSSRKLKWITGICGIMSLIPDVGSPRSVAPSWVELGGRRRNSSPAERMGGAWVTVPGSSYLLRVTPPGFPLRIGMGRLPLATLAPAKLHYEAVRLPLYMSSRHLLRSGKQPTSADGNGFRCGPTPGDEGGVNRAEVLRYGVFAGEKHAR